jgi:hypothetical protein
VLLDDLDEYGTTGPGDVTGLLLEPVAWHKDAASTPTQRSSFPSVVAHRGPRARCAPSARSCGPVSNALANGEEYGVFGGTTPRERQRLRRAQRELLKQTAVT